MTQNTLQYALTALVVVACPLPVLAAATASDAQAAAAPATTSNVFGDHTDVTVGAGVTYAARYPGAERWQFLPTPVLAIQRGILFADTLRGVGLQYQSSSEFYVSQSLYYDLGRLDRDNSWRPGSARLAGMGIVPGSATSHTVIAQQVTPWLLASAESEMALRATARRNRYRMGVEFTPIKTASDTVSIDIDAWWGDGRYNRAYFGVTPQQAARTGFAVFSPGAGLYAQVPSISWEHHLDAHCSSTIQLTDTRYAGKASASPVVLKRTSESATVAIAYAY